LILWFESGVRIANSPNASRIQDWRVKIQTHSPVWRGFVFPSHWPFLHVYVWPVGFCLGECKCWSTRQFGECLEKLIHTPAWILPQTQQDEEHSHFPPSSAHGDQPATEGAKRYDAGVRISVVLWRYRRDYDYARWRHCFDVIAVAPSQMGCFQAVQALFNPNVSGLESVTCL
jgi:hypothetical protein